LEAEDAVSTIAALAMRTIAFGYKDLPQDINFASLDESMKQPDECYIIVLYLHYNVLRLFM
jgi:hypothetical protein